MKNGSKVGWGQGEDGVHKPYGGGILGWVALKDGGVTGQVASPRLDTAEGPVWGGTGLILGLKRASMTLTRGKACLDSVHRRREMETVNTDNFMNKGEQRNWVVTGKEFM